MVIASAPAYSYHMGLALVKPFLGVLNKIYLARDAQPQKLARCLYGDVPSSVSHGVLICIFILKTT